MTRTPIALALLAVTAGLLGACSSGTKPPRFQLVSARAADRTDEGVRIEFTLVGENPNDHDIELGEAIYRASAGGVEFFKGAQSPEVALPRYGRVELILAASAPPGMIPPGATSVTLSGWIEYMQPGPFAEVLYDAGLRRPTTAIEGTATLSP